MQRLVVRRIWELNQSQVLSLMHEPSLKSRKWLWKLAEVGASSISALRWKLGFSLMLTIHRFYHTIKVSPLSWHCKFHSEAALWNNLFYCEALDFTPDVVSLLLSSSRLSTWRHFRAKRPCHLKKTISVECNKAQLAMVQNDLLLKVKGAWPARLGMNRFLVCSETMDEHLTSTYPSVFVH